jgi:hypothetical protein
MVTEKDDLVNVDPAVHLYGQILQPLEDCCAEPVARVMGRVQSFRADGSAVSPGVLVPFILVSRDSGWVTYRSQKPMILIDNARFEGEHSDLIAIFANDNCSAGVFAP